MHDDINKDTTYGIQAALRLKPTDALTLTPRVMYQKLKSDSPNLADSSVTNLAKIRQFDVDEIGRDTWWLAALEADLDVGVGTVTSSTSYFHRDTRDDEDATIFIASNLLAGRVRVALSAPSVTTEVSEQKRFAEEIRFVSKFEGRLQVIAGAFFQNIEEDGGFPATGSIIPGNSPLVTSPGLAAVGFRAGDNFFSLDTRTEQREFGLFGEVEYDLTEQLTATLGGRFFDLKADQYRADGGTLFTKFYRVFAGFPPPAPYSNSTKENGFNPKAAIRWEPSQDLTIYATAAKGFRPGQVNASKGACQALGVANVPDSVDSDSLWNYELGAKASLAGGRVTANAAVFHIDWKDRQTQTINCGLGFGASTNVGKVESEGFDAEVAFEPIDNLRFTGAVGYSDAKVTNTGGAAGVTLGDRLPNVPKWNGAAAVDYSHEFTDSIEGYGRIDYRYVGASISTLRRVRPAYELVNARLGVRYGDWDVSLFAQNLFDERANLADITPLSDSLQLVGVSRPRTIGLDLRTRF